MLFGKKKYKKNVTRDNEFLKTYDVKINGLLPFVKDNEKITNALKELQDLFHYTVATALKDAKAIEKDIAKLYAELDSAVEQPELDEAFILLTINKIRKQIENINALRRT